MSKPEQLGLVFVGALWVFAALFFTVLGRNDRKPWPINFGQTYVAWLIVEAPTVLVLGVHLLTPFGRWLGFFSCLIAGTILGALTYAHAPRLPLIGQWVAALHRRETERAEKGIL